MKLLPRRFLPERPMRLPRLRPYVPQPTDPPIFWFNSERDDIVREVVRRIVESKAQSGRMELVLNDVAYHEAERLERQRDQESRDSLGFWRGVLRRVGRMSDAEKKDVRNAYFDLSKVFDPHEHFLLRVRGNSMILDGIRDGDLAIVRPANVANAGDTVVAVVDGGEATLKRFRKVKDTITLIPANDLMTATDYAASRVEIRGVFVGLVRTAVALSEARIERDICLANMTLSWGRRPTQKCLGDWAAMRLSG